MDSFKEEFGHLKIHLQDLKKATNNFNDSKVIGFGGFGKVYEGEVSHSRGRSMVAIKRLSPKSRQGQSEFLKEISMLCRYRHRNLISLLGFCDEVGERILVYEHASKGSLDRHLNSTALSWTQRLKICIDVAKGLAFLHEPNVAQQRVIHRDIKSGNILLDENWNAKVSDMGFSRYGPADQPHSYIITDAVGTHGYCDPQCINACSLSKESDVYSFGVVLFEVLCGRLCFEYTKGRLEFLVSMWMQSYESNKLDKIIFKDLTPHIDPTTLKTFSDIAYECLHGSRKQRPTMSFLIKKLEVALRFQERHDVNMTNVAGITKRIRCDDELSVPLSKGEGALFLNICKMVISYFDDTLGFKASDLYRAKAERAAKNMYCSDYKLTLENGFEVAIKILREKVTKSHGEFEAELKLVSKIRHPNLLATRAYILDPQGDKILVFDYMPKGSLAAFLHAQRPKTQVDWAIRMQIAKGVARGLHSLHTHHNIIHGNLTSANVFLDENINPKISDFGLSRLMTTASHSHMISAAWSLGYQAPEVTKVKKADTKADVYSLGMIILELLTRKSPGEVKDLPQRVVLIAKKDWTTKVFDHELMKDASVVVNDELLKSLKLALQCVRPSPQDRPDARLVLQQLEEIRPEIRPETASTMRLR